MELRPEFVLELSDAEIPTMKNALQRLLARPEPPTALFVGADECVKLYPLLGEMKIDVPGRLSVAGYRMEGDSDASGIDYSSIIQPTARVGRYGVTRLLELVSSVCDKVDDKLDNTVNFGETVRRIGGE